MPLKNTYKNSKGVLNFFRSRFSYTQSEKNGIFIWLVFLLLMELVIWWQESQELEGLRDIERQVIRFKREQDSLRKVALERGEKHQEPYHRKINVHRLSDFQSYMIGMRPEHYDLLLRAINKGQKLRDAGDLQEITGMSKKELNALLPQLYFPRTFTGPKDFDQGSGPSDPSPAPVPAIELNAATTEQLQKVKGVGPVLSKRIVAYRQYLKAYSEMNQLHEVYGLRPEVVERIAQRFELRTKPNIQKQNINTLDFNALMKIPYLDYPMVRAILALKREEVYLEDLSILKEIDSMTTKKYERIALYLYAE